MSDALRVWIDQELCTGDGLCVQYAPEVFEFDIDGLAYVKDGTVSEFALWNPEDLGYLAAYAANALVDGSITGAEGDSFDAGTLGKFSVDSTGTVLLGKPFVFDKSNIDQFNF